jgi:tRNA(Ile2) C34 agmatinyltransferase TiaS
MRQGDGVAAQRTTAALVPPGERLGATEVSPRRAPEWTRCDACGSGMQSMGHCKWLCRSCGFLRTCIDTV